MYAVSSGLDVERVDYRIVMWRFTFNTVEKGGILHQSIIQHLCASL